MTENEKKLLQAKHRLEEAQMPSSGASAAASAVQSTAGSKLVTWYCYDRK